LSGLTSADGWSRLAVAMLGVGERRYD
jgi:hypothetical protein